MGLERRDDRTDFRPAFIVGKRCSFVKYITRVRKYRVGYSENVFNLITIPANFVTQKLSTSLQNKYGFFY